MSPGKPRAPAVATPIRHAPREVDRCLGNAHPPPASLGCATAGVDGNSTTRRDRSQLSRRIGSQCRGMDGAPPANRLPHRHRSTSAAGFRSCAQAHACDRDRNMATRLPRQCSRCAECTAKPTGKERGKRRVDAKQTCRLSRKDQLPLPLARASKPTEVPPSGAPRHNAHDYLLRRNRLQPSSIAPRAKTIAR